MRPERTPYETKILDRMEEVLAKYSITNPVLIEEITDRPDILYKYDQGRLGIEISRLDYEHYCKWLSTPPPQPYDRAADVEINLNKMLSTVMKKKKKKYREYKRHRNLSECWLILHNNVFEFDAKPHQDNMPSIDWVQHNTQIELQDLKCPYDRVLFNLEHPNVWYEFFNKKKPTPARVSTKTRGKRKRRSISGITSWAQ